MQCQQYAMPIWPLQHLLQEVKALQQEAQDSHQQVRKTKLLLKQLERQMAHSLMAQKDPAAADRLQVGSPLNIVV